MLYFLDADDLGLCPQTNDSQDMGFSTIFFGVKVQNLNSRKSIYFLKL